MERVNWHTLTLLFDRHALAPQLKLVCRPTLRARAMSHPKAVRLQRWFSNWRSAARPAPDTDPADLGTAYGLEMSLLEHPVEPAAPVAARRPAWIRRLTSRHRPAT